MRQFVLALMFFSLILTGCEKGPKSSAHAPLQECKAGISNDVIATIGTAEIRFSDLDSAKLDEKLRSQLVDSEGQFVQMQKMALDAKILDELLKMEAKKLSMSVEDLRKKEIADKVGAVSDKEVQEFYGKVSGERNKAGRQTPPLDKVRDQIEQNLNRERSGKREETYFGELREQYSVTYMKRDRVFSRPRFEVATGDLPVKGDENAPITIVEFSDFECPYCKRAAETVKEVAKAYKGKVKIYFRDFPLDFHKKAKQAHVAARCASDQGKFWEYHDKLFNTQKLERADLLQHAKDIGLKAADFEKCIDDKAMMAKLDADIAAGKELGVTGTPAFFINGVKLTGARPFNDFKAVIDEELKAK